MQILQGLLILLVICQLILLMQPENTIMFYQTDLNVVFLALLLAVILYIMVVLMLTALN